MQHILLASEQALLVVIVSLLILLVSCIATSYWAETGVQRERMKRMKAIREASLRKRKHLSKPKPAIKKVTLTPEKIESEQLRAWLCPMCSSSLTLENVRDLKEGKLIICPFCNVTIG